ncbi:hypothetical protein AWB68_06270 [Caballeronia choica]|uniref:DUF2971 domain-containing protein n=1 Tax=Caballeronia choica TaxID=326476 RepID=A0A158KL08_9BURK|nr:DUF2971 domain-containing protein [Caballeronia choica]SAL81812.1 hypothetical protein AWB68_06270 [Caballeronia choica]
MLMDRLFKPQSAQRLYHYCSAESFRAILESGRLRFSDINMLNDAMEYRWGYSIFEEAATRLIKRIDVSDNVPQMDIAFFHAVDEILSKGQLIAHPFVSCLSFEANSLDQWRKYADDGRGYAIGFLASSLQHMPISLLEVSYDREVQVKEMMAALVATHSRSSPPELPLQGESAEDVALIAAYMAAFKHPSFASEREVRCLHAISLEKIQDSFRFVSRGTASSAGVENKVAFTIRDDALTPHVDLPLTASDGSCPIVEVATGPKNPTKMGNVFLFLGSQGHSNVAVRPSDLPYR